MLLGACLGVAACQTQTPPPADYGAYDIPAAAPTNLKLASPTRLKARNTILLTNQVTMKPVSRHGMAQGFTVRKRLMARHMINMQ